MATAVGRGCFFQITAQVSSITNSKFNLVVQPNRVKTPVFLSPRLSTQLSLSSRPHRRFATAAITLPTAKPERVINEEKIRRSARALKLGTESILLGILVDATTEATKFLHKIGVTLSNVREETYKFIDWDWRYDYPENFTMSDSSSKSP